MCFARKAQPDDSDAIDQRRCRAELPLCTLWIVHRRERVVQQLDHRAVRVETIGEPGSRPVK